ncbi:glycosyltransferase [Marimonas sp. MJW-29]|uniref:Glycosyltransferase n=1 Tax=Sulfitobacter sediminis TaxID=3234186 RepID=A0ABV3RQ09_9RHOB
MSGIVADLPPGVLPGTTASASDRPLRVLLWGTYDLSKPRTRILRDGLVDAGAEVTEIHADIWGSDVDKSQLSRATMALRLLKLLLVYPLLVLRYMRAPQHDVVLVPYLGQFDVIVLKPFALLRGRPVVLDLFISLYDTVVHDRKMARPDSLVARLLKVVEGLSCRAADQVLLDTGTHAERIAALFGLKREKLDAVPVGAEPGIFAQVPERASHDGPTRILFYGQLIPLHGVQTILNAALSERGRQFDWHIIGSGQDQRRVAEALANDDASHITWDTWVPYEELADAIAKTDVCLGIFGTSDKAASVVPNKVYQSLFAKRPVITRDSAAMRELFPEDTRALRLVPPADPDALLDAVEALAHDGFPAIDPEHLKAAQPSNIAKSLCAKLATVAERN